MIGVWDTVTGAEINCDKVRNTNATVTLTFGSAPSLNAYRVLVLSNGNSGGGGGSSSSATPWTISTITTGTVLSSAPNAYFVFISTGGSVTMPSAIGNVSQYVLKNITSSSTNVTASSSQTIEGQSFLTLAAGSSATIISDGSNWRIV